MTRANVVLARGDIPCDVLFIGEAPGPAENNLGSPFKGPAGHLLDEIVANAVAESGVTLRMAYTNLVACIPLEDGSTKFTEPPKASIDACHPRLAEFARMCNPEIVVAVGALSEKYIGKKWETGNAGWIKRFAKIIHPAAILRGAVAQRGLAQQNAEVTLIEAFESLIPF